MKTVVTVIVAENSKAVIDLSALSEANLKVVTKEQQLVTAQSAGNGSGGAPAWTNRAQENAPESK